MATPSSSLLSSVIQLYTDQVLVSFLVLTRLSGLAMAAPVVGSRSVPVRLRALLVLALSGLIAPLHWGTSIDMPDNLVQLALLVSHEVLIGLALGLGATILLLGVQLAGHIAGHMSGMALADALDPNFDASIPIVAQLLDVITILLFIAMGGHRMIVDALLDTFQWMPPGTAGLSANALNCVIDVLRESFVLGIRAAAPIILSLLLSILVMGLISRTLPQLNILAIGLSLNSMVMLAMLAVSLGALGWIFQDEVEPAIGVIGDMFARR